MDENRLQRRWLKEDDRAVDAAVGALLEHATGRKMLWWLLEIGKVGQQPFSADPHMTAFSCGELNVGQRILDRIVSVSPTGYVTMMQEQANERTDRDRAIAAARGQSADDYPDADSGSDRAAEGAGAADPAPG